MLLTNVIIAISQIAIAEAVLDAMRVKVSALVAEVTARTAQERARELMDAEEKARGESW